MRRKPKVEKRYAAGTSVPVGRSQGEIRDLVLSNGGDGWMVGEDRREGRTLAVVNFRLMGRVLRFRLELPDKPDPAEERRRWRALLLAIKAKITIAKEGIETVDEVFLANIVTPDGSTVGDRIVPDVQRMIETGDRSPLMLGPGR